MGIDSPSNISDFIDNLQDAEAQWDPTNPDANAALVEGVVNQSLAGQGLAPTQVESDDTMPANVYGGSGRSGIDLNENMLTQDGLTGDLVNTAVHEHVHSAQWQIAQQIKDHSMVQNPDGTWRPPTDEENDIYENLAGINKGFADLIQSPEDTTDPGTHLGQKIGVDADGNDIFAPHDDTVDSRYFNAYEAMPEEVQARTAGDSAEAMYNDRMETAANFEELPGSDAME
jgi:hypothetical protein